MTLNRDENSSTLKGVLLSHDDAMMILSRPPSPPPPPPPPARPPPPPPWGDSRMKETAMLVVPHIICRT